MAFPLLALAALLSGGGIAANMIGSGKARDAQANVMSAERQRKTKHDEQSYAANERAVRRYEGGDEKMAEKTGDLREMFLEGSGAGPDLGMPASGSNVTVSHAKKKDAKAKEYTDQQAGAKAKLMSLQDMFGEAGRGVGRDAEDISQANSFSRGSQNVLPFELDAAAQQGGGWRLAGDLLGGAGSIATMGALTGAQLPGADLLAQFLPNHAGRMAGARLAQPAANPTLMSLY